MRLGHSELGVVEGVPGLGLQVRVDGQHLGGERFHGGVEQWDEQALNALRHRHPEGVQVLRYRGYAVKGGGVRCAGNGDAALFQAVVDDLDERLVILRPGQHPRVKAFAQGDDPQGFEEFPLLQFREEILLKPRDERDGGFAIQLVKKRFGVVLFAEDKGSARLAELGLLRVGGGQGIVAHQQRRLGVEAVVGDLAAVLLGQRKDALGSAAVFHVQAAAAVDGVGHSLDALRVSAEADGGQRVPVRVANQRIRVVGEPDFRFGVVVGDAQEIWLAHKL